MHSLRPLVRCRAAVQEREGGVREVARELEALQGTISQLRRQVSAAEERIPQLEETKKTAVAGRPLSPLPLPFLSPPFLFLSLLLSLFFFSLCPSFSSSPFSAPLSPPFPFLYFSAPSLFVILFLSLSLFLPPSLVSWAIYTCSSSVQRGWEGVQ